MTSSPANSLNPRSSRGPNADGALRQAALRTISAARREATEHSLRAFLQTYLPAYAKLEFSRMHIELFELLESASTQRGARLAIAAPRDHAKSTLISLACILWCVCFNKEPYILLLSDTAEQAMGHLSHVKHELESNTRLKEDFPNACRVPPTSMRAVRWRKGEIITGNGVKVSALGVDSKLRGRRHREDRPTLIIGDDLENEVMARSPDQRANLAEWFAKAVLKAGSGVTNIVVVGTIVHFDSLLAALVDPAKSPGWTGRVYKAVESWAHRQELWQAWESVFNSRESFEGATGPAAARKYFDANYAAMLEGASVLWPARESYLSLMEMRLTGGLASFNSEKQNEPTNPADCYFGDRDFHFWDDQYPDEGELLSALGPGMVVYGACDPSLGKAGRSRDDTAIITLAKHPDTGVLYVLDADIRRRKPDDLIEALISYHRRRNYSALGFEVNQFQQFLADEARRRSRIAGVEIPVRDLTHTTDKLGRIQRLQPFVTSGGIRFSRRHVTLLNQLRQFPHAAHDDGPDALEMAVSIAQTTCGVWVEWAMPGGRAMGSIAFTKFREDPEWGWEPVT